MCVVSNIGDSYRDRDGWPWRPVDPFPVIPPSPIVPEDFRKIWEAQVKDKQFEELEKRVAALEELIRKGKEYDAATGQPDCELDEKRQALKKIADEMGVEIRFL